MQIKKFVLLAASALTVSFLSVSNSKADTDYLQVIAQNTTNILGKVNNLPDYINQISTYILNWQKSDDSKSTADMQVNFDGIGKAVTQNNATQNGQQTQIMADILGIPMTSFTEPKDKPAILGAIPQVNSLSYATLLGLPPVPKGAANPYDYIKNAAGLSLNHAAPNDVWKGQPSDKNRYQGYYNSLMAVESYDAYLLSGLWAELQNGNSLTTAQNNLVSQASNSSWISTIASEELGIVLRQILMFQSQTYVLLTQLLQTQKQLLAATAMTNTLLILNAQGTETILSGKAQGTL